MPSDGSSALTARGLLSAPRRWSGKRHSEIEKRLGPIPTYPDLLAHFTAEGLRRVRLPMRWLGETARVHIDPQQREDASDRRRIDAIIASIPSETSASRVLLAYEKALQARVLRSQEQTWATNRLSAWMFLPHSKKICPRGTSSE